MTTRAERPARSARDGRRIALAAGLVSTLFALLWQWPGVVLSPDGWAYWEGSVSLLEGNGYRNFGGQPITGWPPGFSAYLALWQAVAGRSAGVLAVAHAVAIGVAAALWVASANAAGGGRPPGLRRVALAVVFALALPIALREILSESLFMALLGGAVLVGLSGTSTEMRQGPWRARELARGTLFALLLAALLLTRHVGAAFLPALVWLYWRSSRRISSRSALVAAAGGAAAVALWFASRALLGQLAGPARIELDRTAPARIAEILGANFSAAWQIVAPRSLVAAVACALVFALFVVALRSIRWPSPGELDASAARARSALPFATSLAALFGAAAWAVHGVSGARIVLPVVALLLLLLSEAAERGASPARRRIATAALACTATVQLLRGGYWVVHAASAEARAVDWRQRLVPACAPEEAGCTLAADEIAPPDVPWVDRSYSARRAGTGKVP